MIDKQRVAANFSRHASHYDQHAQLQRDLLDNCLQHLAELSVPRVVCDLGCGTGYGLRQLTHHFPQAYCIGLDIAHGMLAAQQAPRDTLTTQINKTPKLLQSDIENLPFKASSLDMAVASASLQWCTPQIALHEIHRCLVDGGTLVFTTFTQGTFPELRRAYETIRVPPAVHHQAPVQQWIDEAKSAGFDPSYTATRSKTFTFRTADALLASIRQLGAGYADQRPTRLSRAQLTALKSALESPSGDYPLSFECFSMIATARK